MVFSTCAAGMICPIHFTTQYEKFASCLAFGTIKRAARRLDDSLDGGAACDARFARAVVNAQALLIKVRRVGGAAKIKQSITGALARVIERNRAAEFDGFAQRLANRLPQPCHLRGIQTPRRQPW